MADGKKIHINEYLSTDIFLLNICMTKAFNTNSTNSTKTTTTIYFYFIIFINRKERTKKLIEFHLLKKYIVYIKIIIRPDGDCLQPK